MKKSFLWQGLGFIAGGLVCLALSLTVARDTPIGSLLCGFAGALIAPGTAQVLRYRKWSRPENAEAYRQKLEEEAIELRDERKEMLRNKSGRYAFVAGLLLCAAAMVVFSVLGDLGVVAEHRLIVLSLGGLMIAQIVAFFRIYRALERRY